ncbi:MAG: hypothetical protein HIU89_12580 [Proteobacteria bacterium]|nr:hypothetical protein [Pseudomonadota bacterium]
MELQEFIKQSLVQIVNGMAEAQQEVAAKGASVNPSGLKLKDDQVKGHSVSNDGNVTQHIEFDVAVTTTEGTGTKGGIGVVMGVLALGSQGQSSASSQAISRLKFTIPMLLPSDHRSDKEDRDRRISENMTRLSNSMSR